MNILSALIVAGIVMASLQVHRPSSGLQVSVLSRGPQAIAPGALIQVRHASNVEVMAGHRLPRSGRVTFRLAPGRYVVEARTGPGRSVTARLGIRVTAGRIILAPLRLSGARPAAPATRSRRAARR